MKLHPWFLVVCALCLSAAGAARAGYTADVSGGTLFITGNGLSDKLALYLSPLDSNILYVDVKDDDAPELFFNRSTFTSIAIDAGGGNDRVEIKEATARSPTRRSRSSAEPATTHSSAEPAERRSTAAWATTHSPAAAARTRSTRATVTTRSGAGRATTSSCWASATTTRPGSRAMAVTRSKVKRATTNSRSPPRPAPKS